MNEEKENAWIDLVPEFVGAVSGLFGRPADVRHVDKIREILLKTPDSRRAIFIAEAVRIFYRGNCLSKEKESLEKILRVAEEILEPEEKKKFDSLVAVEMKLLSDRYGFKIERREEEMF